LANLDPQQLHLLLEKNTEQAAERIQHAMKNHQLELPSVDRMLKNRRFVRYIERFLQQYNIFVSVKLKMISVDLKDENEQYKEDKSISVGFLNEDIFDVAFFQQ